MLSRRLLCTTALLAPWMARAQSGDPKFAAWLAGVRAEAARAGVDQGTLDSALMNIEPIPRVMELARDQPEFKMTFDRYMEIVVSPERVTRGRALLKRGDRAGAKAALQQALKLDPPYLQRRTALEGLVKQCDIFQK